MQALADAGATEIVVVAAADRLAEATRLLDAQTTTLADALSAEVSARQAAVTSLQEGLDGLLGGTLAGKSAKFDTATVAVGDTGLNRVTVTGDIDPNLPVLVYLNGQLVETANLVTGQPKKIDLPDLPSEAFSQSIQVLYYV